MPTCGSSIYDVAVVGGGPAGSSSALKLAEGGARVVLLEKKELPRYKTCGGGVVHKARNLLTVDISPVVEREFFSAILSFHNSSISFEAKEDVPIISMTMRASFDNLLVCEAENAGAQIKRKTKVRSIASYNDHVELATNVGALKASFVIIADGADGGLAKKAGWQNMLSLAPAVESELYLTDREMERYGEKARFDFDIHPMGYGWLFPKKDHISAGVLSFKRGKMTLNEAFRNYLRALGITNIEKEERHGFVIPMMPRRDGFARDRIILAGDAAGFVDPVTAEGISFAILSGFLAARALLEKGVNNPHATDRYEAFVNKYILGEISAARILKRILYLSPQLRTWAFRTYGVKLARLVCKIVKGENTYQRAISDPTNFLKLIKYFFLRQ